MRAHSLTFQMSWAERNPNPSDVYGHLNLHKNMQILKESTAEGGGGGGWHGKDMVTWRHRKKPCTKNMRWGPLPPSEMDRAGFLPVWQSEGCVVRFYSDAPVLLVNQPSLLSPGRPMVTHHRCHPYMTLGRKKNPHAHTQANTHTSILYNVPYLSQWHESKQAKVAERRDHRANEWQLALKHGGLVLRRPADNHLIFLTEMFHSEKCPPASHLTLTEGVQCRISHE